jgi:hypothetical protein
MGKERIMTEILGYYGGDVTKPIYATERGTITTQAFILCSQCGAAIKSNGGPAFGAWCPTCMENKEGDDNDYIS